MSTAARATGERSGPPLPPDAAVEVRPDDEAAMQQVEGWFSEYATHRDPALRERIILAYLGLADRLADRYRANRSVSLEDLRQVARLGLVKAVDRYEPERANPFVPYAVATVIGEIKRHLRDASWRLRVPRGTKDLALRLCRAVDELPQQLGHSPTVAELAGHLGASEDEVLEAIEVAQTRSAPSLDQPAGEDGDAVLGDFVMDGGARSSACAQSWSKSELTARNGLAGPWPCNPGAEGPDPALPRGRSRSLWAPAGRGPWAVDNLWCDPRGCGILRALQQDEPEEPCRSIPTPLPRASPGWRS